MNRASSARRSSFSPYISLFPLLLLLLSTACNRGSTEASGPLAGSPLSMPPEGNVRIVSRKIEKTPDRIHWKWSLIGERNWSEAAATGKEIRLDNPSPLNSPNKKSGCNIWEADITVERRATTPGKLLWTTRIHGSDGTTKEDKGEIADIPGAVSDSVRIELPEDSVVRLPTSTSLAQFGDNRVTLSVAK